MKSLFKVVLFISLIYISVCKCPEDYIEQMYRICPDAIENWKECTKNGCWWDREEYLANYNYEGSCPNADLNQNPN